MQTTRRGRYVLIHMPPFAQALHYFGQVAAWYAATTTVPSASPSVPSSLQSGGHTDCYSERHSSIGFDDNSSLNHAHTATRWSSSK